MKLMSMAENPRVIMMFLRKFTRGTPSPSVTAGAVRENLLTAAKMTKARLQIRVNFDKKDNAFICS